MDSFSTTVSDFFSSSTSFLDIEGFQDEVLWIMIVGFIIAFILAAGVGANDVANTFGTSVGSGVVTLRTACIMATIFEMLGAVLIGAKVSETIRKGIVDPEVYKDEPREYMLGNLAALGGSATWLILATFLKMPISGTHSIVGSVLGYSLVAHGTTGIQWFTMGKIVGSWFLSPLLSGAVSGSIFWLIRRFILSKPDPITPGLRSLPIFYGLTVVVNIISITMDGPEWLKVKLEDHAWFETFFGAMISIVLGLTVAILIFFVMVPKLKKEIEKDSKEQTPINISMSDFHSTEKSLDGGLKMNGNGYINTHGFTTIVEPNHNVNEKDARNGSLTYNNMNNGVHNNGHPVKLDVIPVDGLSQNGSAVPLIKSGTGTTVSSLGIENGNVIHIDGLDVEGNAPPKADDSGDQPGVGKLFSWLQILTAAFGSFAHGGNDVSNAIGPLIALYLVYKEGVVETQADTPIWLLIFGGVGISLGLWIWGRRVIKTMGEDLTKITPSSGFTIEIGAAITVLLASKVGLPVSTTHCKVGSVVTVGQIRTRGGVDWKLFRNIFFAWIVTVPVSGGLSAILMVILRAIV